MLPIRNIQFESSTACNANCIFCPRSDMARAHGTMSDDLFYKIITEGKQANPYANFIPFLNGEPFAFPRIFEWLDYMEQQEVSIHLFTNASLLSKEKIDRLVRNKMIRYIYCSINAATPETYAKVVRGPDFATTAANIHYLLSKRPSFKVRIGMVETEDTMADMELHRRTWGKRARGVNFRNWAGARHDALESRGRKIPCHDIRHNITILWDGRVCLCCMDYDGQVILGDLNQQSLSDIWTSSAWLRDKHARLEFTDLPLCGPCNSNVRPLIDV